jgi:hypothetical protein
MPYGEKQGVTAGQVLRWACGVTATGLLAGTCAWFLFDSPFAEPSWTTYSPIYSSYSVPTPAEVASQSYGYWAALAAFLTVFALVILFTLRGPGLGLSKCLALILATGAAAWCLADESSREVAEQAINRVPSGVPRRYHYYYTVGNGGQQDHARLIYASIPALLLMSSLFLAGSARRDKTVNSAQAEVT